MQNGYNGFEFKPAEDARAVKCPVLVFHGENDTRVLDAEAQAVYDQLGGEKKYVSVPGIEHELSIVREPQLWEQNVAMFLASVEHDR